MSNVTMLAIVGIPPGQLIAMALAIVLLALLLAGIRQPLAWVVVAVLAIGTGVGCAGYGIVQVSLVRGAEASNIAELAAICIGGGVGTAVAGILLLVVGMLRCRKGAAPRV